MIAWLRRWLDPQERTLDKYRGLVNQINAIEEQVRKLSDKKFPQRISEIRELISGGHDPDQYLPEVFALVREAARRKLNQRHYDVQLMAGIAFHEGKIAEQKTGEGKTLSATLALSLNALKGQGAHLVTVNDYLAQVGAGWMGPVYHMLGFSVGVITSDSASIYDPEYTGQARGDERLEHFRPVSRKIAYNADITYGTNNEFGFDYLRDNMAPNLASQVQRGHAFAIVDEADSILIDEARTPLIISAPDAEPTHKYVEFDKLVRQLAPSTDFLVDEKMRTATLTDLGVKRLERSLNISNLYEESFSTIHHVEQALKSHFVFHRDKDYVVRDGQVIIVDEHTGRLMIGRRYSDGLHQALEAKEGVAVQQESRTLATITLQNYFRLYSKLAGMSGTATTAAEELRAIYSLDVVVIPTHRPIARYDHPDYVYKSVRAKYSAMVKEIAEISGTGRPILIGTRSIEQNQILSDLLKRKGVKHQVLNAKNHEKEAFILAQAGTQNSITLATNIAGRGVDIILGGAQPEERAFDSAKEFAKAKEQWLKAHDAVVALGGLHVIGSERHESRRIDNQLRGRAGRQGDPGSSRFYVSLEDEIMRIFGGEQIISLMNTLKIEDDVPIDHPFMTKALTQAQIKVEGFFYDQRKSLVDYDDVMNRQREVIYARRQALLNMAENPNESVLNLPQYYQEAFANTLQPLTNDSSEAAMQTLLQRLAFMIPFDEQSLEPLRTQLANQDDGQGRMALLNKIYTDISKLRNDTLGSELWQDLQRYALLSSLDEKWMDHMDEIQSLRDSIWLRGGRDQSLADYKKEAFQLFQDLLAKIDEEALRRLFRLQPMSAQAQATAPQAQLTLSGPSQETSAETIDLSSSGLVTKSVKASRQKLNKKGKPKKVRKGTYV